MSEEMVKCLTEETPAFEHHHNIYIPDGKRFGIPDGTLFQVLQGSIIDCGVLYLGADTSVDHVIRPSPRIVASPPPVMLRVDVPVSVLKRVREKMDRQASMKNSIKRSV